MRNLRWLSLLAALPLAALLEGCVWFKGQNLVLVTTEPPGAHIFIDGHDSGRTTPASFDMAGNFGSDHDLELQKHGYRTERRHLYQYTYGYTSKWIDGAAGPDLPPLPIFWTAGDLFFPFGVHGALVPGELYVKLYREDEPLLGFDLLAQQAAAAGKASASAGSK
jgi:hypothetical protein